MYRIECADDKPFGWQLFDAAGHLLQSGNGRQTAIVDASASARGLYLLRVDTAHGVFIEKLRQ